MSNNHNSNWNHRGGTSSSNVYNAQYKKGGGNQAMLKPQCHVCQKFHFGVCRYKGKTKCGTCNHFGHSTKDYDCHNNKQLANCAKKEESITVTILYACHAASVKDEDV